LILRLTWLSIQNAANSSGIPFVKSYQNGILIPQAFNLKTLITKIIGCISAVSSNMPVGPEGTTCSSSFFFLLYRTQV
jgi:H+/Cl- antiporter ClcA